MRSLRASFVFGENMSEDDFLIKIKYKECIVIRIGGAYEQHAHLRNISSAKGLINLLMHGLLPKSDYLKESARRLLTEEEYSNLKIPKDKYYNKPKGLRRV